jgi:hypothetical protein
MLYRVHLAWVGFELTTFLVIGAFCIDRSKYNVIRLRPRHAPHKFIKRKTLMTFQHCNGRFNCIDVIMVSVWILIMLAHWNFIPRVDISVHSDTLSWFKANQYLLFQAACIAEKQHILILQSLVWPDWNSNPRTTALETSTSVILMIYFCVIFKHFTNLQSYGVLRHFQQYFSYIVECNNQKKKTKKQTMTHNALDRKLAVTLFKVRF